ncbi:MAG: DUF4011 domain-containing protein [Christensenellaceae bacterium]|jgi:superfamily I DNA and/or RNA helicase|nr:DUF4011 domain-containing protein [Christensenellaceae bacterium]
MKGIYKYYKDRLIEISGRNRSLFSKKISKKYSYDIGANLDGDYEEIEKFIDFLWRGRRSNFVLIGKNSKERLYKNLRVEDKVVGQYKDPSLLDADGIKAENLRRERIKKDETKKALLSQLNDLKTLKREIEEFAKETGRYEMFVGYPFVEGALGHETVIKAPLLLFPVVINVENEQAELELKTDEPIQLNKVFILAYAKHHKLNIDELNLEFDNLMDYKLKNIESVVEYLRVQGIKIGHSPRKGLFNFERGKEPKLGDSLEVKYYAVVGRFPLANAIYNDYNVLEKKKLTTNAINELLESRELVSVKKPNANTYTISNLDYAQENAIESINKFGNMVIYGPPGTGKSQTIVNIITDALCKGKRVLVVSQKKAALDVVYNRLGVLNNKAMYINDAEKNKTEFYERVKNAHLELNQYKETPDLQPKYNETDTLIRQETALLEMISDTLFNPTPFGLNLQQMYANSYMIGKNTNEYAIYKELIKNTPIMNLNYNELSNTVRIIKEKRKAELYYKHLEMQKNNPLIDHIKRDLDVHVINSMRGFLNKLKTKRIAPFDIGKYPNARQLLAFYLENGIEEPKDLKPIVKYIAGIENPGLKEAVKWSLILPPLYPFAKAKMIKKQNQIADNFKTTLISVKEYVKEYESLQTVLDKKGYAIIIDNILGGNMLFLNLLESALDNYVNIRDMHINLRDMTPTEMMILNFAYANSNSVKTFKEVVDKITVIRIYHEIVLSEEKYKMQLSKIMEFENIKNRIMSLKNDKESIVQQICLGKFKKEYAELYNKDPNNKNFLYQISKPQNLWPIRKIIEVYEELLFKLFPCWLLSPESVSTIMPLKKELFDLILFDEASQIFIESTLPTIFRGKYIAIAGDNKQLRPTTTFMRRYMGNDNDELDLDTQAALEVESLLDLATSRYNTANLTYHYRSKNEELINFSNFAFYDGRLQIAPNLTKNVGSHPIEVSKVNGKWLNSRNHEEALRVVEIVKKIFKTRKNNETIGIITFNAEQEQHIEDMLDFESERDPVFRNDYLKECNRKENGEDISLFIKNLENVQGDERDIIIFSIGYAKNEYGKVVSHFGPLNLEGGENRLNVAITRAKQKIYVVTSIEPEELNVEASKNLGPKLFKKYLGYARAVSKGSSKEVGIILESLKQTNEVSVKTNERGIEAEIKEALEKMGYTVELNLGNNTYKLTLAVYDKKLDIYTVGVECDYSAYKSSSSIIERDVFRSKFMESRGWKIIRVWSRDFWLSPQKIINLIARTADRNRERIMAQRSEFNKQRFPQ